MTATTLLPAELAMREGDERDALRIINAAVAIAAFPAIMSPRARAMAQSRLRALAHDNPMSAEILAAVVQHLESS